MQLHARRCGQPLVCTPSRQRKCVAACSACFRPIAAPGLASRPRRRRRHRPRRRRRSCRRPRQSSGRVGKAAVRVVREELQACTLQWPPALPCEATHGCPHTTPPVRLAVWASLHVVAPVWCLPCSRPGGISAPFAQLHRQRTCSASSCDMSNPPMGSPGRRTAGVRWRPLSAEGPTPKHNRSRLRSHTHHVPFPSASSSSSSLYLAQSTLT